MMTIHDYVREWTSIRQKAFTQRRIIVWVRTVIIGLLVAAMWAYLRPDAIVEQTALSLAAIFLAIYFASRTDFVDSTEDDIRLGLDVRFSDVAFDPYRQDSLVDEELKERLHKLLQRSARRLHSDNLAFASTVIPLGLLFASFVTLAPEGVSNALRSAQRAFINWGAGITIISGKSKSDDADFYRIGTFANPKIEVNEDNLIEITLPKSLSAQDVVELRKGEQLFQSFMLQASEDESQVSLRLRVPETTDVFIPSYSQSRLATIKVAKLPIPTVNLRAVTPLAEEWASDQPLRLQISALAETPLKRIQLVVIIGKKRHEELVNNILSEDLKSVETDYDLLLDPYLESDIADVEVFAEAIDKTLPKSLVGKSSSLQFRAVSAYGRYQQTLDTLRRLKTKLDESMVAKKPSLDAESKELIDKALRQSLTSPFFDGLDRNAIDSFAEKVDQQLSNPERSELTQLAERLNQFLFEHEMIDDRERDRDYFIALRSLSRQIESKSSSITGAIEKMSEFLDQRHRRWALRVSRLADDRRPKSYTRIEREKPFHRDLEFITEKTSTKTDTALTEALSRISQSVLQFKNWIEELEKAEDESRKEENDKRQQGLASARNEIRELQQKQAEISQGLDRAAEKTSLGDDWAPLRMKQNSNVTATRKLEGTTRSLSPQAAERIKLAAESMQLTLDSGENGDYINAESASDLAGRLLRQADAAAQRSQDGGNDRGRRRRVTSDQYYGSTIAAGDLEIQRSYEVQKKYREEILDEAQEFMSDENTSEDKRRAIEQYIREVVR